MINIYTNKLIGELLESFKPTIGRDFDKYQNHVYRVFLNCQMMDMDANNLEKYAITAVFHDIGIWTNHTIDYLDPSIEKAKEYLRNAGKGDWIEEISSMIYWHHKTHRFAGNHKETVEVFRRADWIDVSLGIKSFGLDKRRIKENRKNYPNRGFHFFLIRKLMINFLTHPLKPLPMFKS